MRNRIASALAEPAADRREWDLEDEVTAYDANMLAVGRGRQAGSWLRSHLPPGTFRWMKRHEPELRRLVKNATRRTARTTQSTIINADG